MKYLFLIISLAVISGCSTVTKQLTQQLIGPTKSSVKPYDAHMTDVTVQAVSTKDLIYGLTAPDHQITRRVKRLYREELIRRHPQWPLDIQDQIKVESLTLGMSRDQIVASQGLPRIVRRTGNAQGMVEVWEYGMGIQRHALYLNNGVLQEWNEQYMPFSYADVT